MELTQHQADTKMGHLLAFAEEVRTYPSYLNMHTYNSPVVGTTIEQLEFEEKCLARKLYFSQNIKYFSLELQMWWRDYNMAQEVSRIGSVVTFNEKSYTYKPLRYGNVRRGDLFINYQSTDATVAGYSFDAERLIISLKQEAKNTSSKHQYWVAHGLCGEVYISWGSKDSPYVTDTYLMIPPVGYAWVKDT
jgi:hypothetical protein